MLTVCWMGDARLVTFSPSEFLGSAWGPHRDHIFMCIYHYADCGIKLCVCVISVGVHISILDALSARTSVCSIPITVRPKDLRAPNKTEEQVL